MQHPSAEALAQILLIESVVLQFGTREEMLSFVCRGLEDLPGVRAARSLDEGETDEAGPPEGGATTDIALTYDRSRYGAIRLDLGEPAAFAPYRPYVDNLAFMMGVVLEERRLRREVERHRQRLEDLVADRTRALRQRAAELATARDDAVRERERAERYLAVSEAIIVELDDRGRIAVINERGCEMLGRPASDLLGTDWFETVLPDDEREIVRDVFRRAICGDEEPTRYYENDVVDAAGRRHLVAWRNEMRIGSDGRPSGCISSGIDITFRRDAEAERRRAAAERESLLERLHRARKMEALGLLAGGVAHDLNNVLAGIVGYPDLLLLDVPEDSDMREPLEIVRDSGERAAAIVEDLLTVARGSASVRDVDDLNAVVTACLAAPEVREVRTRHPGVAIVPTLAADLLPVACSSTHVRKSLVNLVANAAEAIGDGGTVSVSTRNVYLDRPRLGQSEIPVGEYAVLRVADDGPGIAPADIERIFEPFYTRKVMGRSGTGLGLTVVWNTMQDHRGHVDVASGAEGTRFDLYFPASRESIEGAGEEARLDELRGAGERVLVVDDEPLQRALASRMLRRLGYAPDAAASGEEAVVAAARERYDVVLLDMIMPGGIGGRETYERIVRARPGQRAVIASGFAETEDVRRAQELGAGAFVPKPYTLARLAAAIRAELTR